VPESIKFGGKENVLLLFGKCQEINFLGAKFMLILA
jgi:hypothetical protein